MKPDLSLIDQVTSCLGRRSSSNVVELAKSLISVYRSAFEEYELTQAEEFLLIGQDAEKAIRFICARYPIMKGTD